MNKDSDTSVFKGSLHAFCTYTHTPYDLCPETECGLGYILQQCLARFLNVMLGVLLRSNTIMVVEEVGVEAFSYTRECTKFSDFRRSTHPLTASIAPRGQRHHRLHIFCRGYHPIYLLIHTYIHTPEVCMHIAIP